MAKRYRILHLATGRFVAIDLSFERSTYSIKKEWLDHGTSFGLYGIWDEDVYIYESPTKKECLYLLDKRNEEHHHFYESISIDLGNDTCSMSSKLFVYKMSRNEFEVVEVKE